MLSKLECNAKRVLQLHDGGEVDVRLHAHTLRSSVYAFHCTVGCFLRQLPCVDTFEHTGEIEAQSVLACCVHEQLTVKLTE